MLMREADLLNWLAGTLHKFAVIDGHTLVNGSFNWTRSASDFNQENILVTNESLLVAAYINEFERLWLEFDKH